ncbi:type IV pilus assembly protein PilA [Acetivibrio thermocellus AD2]|jgi:type IV pilus assembly protein PilA|uniref:Type IV pilus assembly protein PilA n=1 Tax=Acetivibrio thermocellus AD2 TaxID=1138384 RepID=A0AB36TER4_ACETH|nr:type II secretion system protein [Acetivibrio thermocellus]ADU74173.1 hypothetical protein Clo1313_1109 [Acetivibrio thermocellus DSM 1313]ALX08116.1 hypothetical protein AD2_01121 [Acetivibrio thermocellus AD2]ANV75863.1 hypothetical protein LQRI_1122 [Acetivibrio thermocellus DSM 2360]EIC05866.1 prepilin-type cleavage/methylation [Acetivibrio thermocellus YS]PFH02387.1 type IV pilus assembly protein PilA [Acetivibrio thermocellus AD2]
MKKMLKNQKGFSLVELLIVIAIMGVLAAIAFSMFAGVLGNAKRRADERTADQIAKALSLYMTDSGDVNLTAFEDNSDPKVIIRQLQEKIAYTPVDEEGNPVGDEKYYGPYLTPKEGDTPAYENFAPQFKNHLGYKIVYYPSLQKADVKPVEEGNENGDEVGVFNGEEE